MKITKHTVCKIVGAGEEREENDICSKGEYHHDVT